MRTRCIFATVLVALVTVAPASNAGADQTWTSIDGEATLILDRSSLAQHELAVSQQSDQAALAALILPIDSKTDLTILTTGRSLIEISRGSLSLSNSFSITSPSGTIVVSNPVVVVEPGSAGGSFKGQITDAAHATPLFILRDGKSSFSNNALGTFFETRGAAVAISANLADMLGNAELTGVTIGRFDVRTNVAFAGGDELPPAEPTTGTGDGAPRAPEGPDVIVGGVGVSGFNGSNPNDVVAFGPVGSLRAYSVATTSCNIGSNDLAWTDCGQQSNPVCAQHPVISQNLYRLKGGRFEHLGQSWLKHGFCALDEFLCDPNCPQGSCDTLGVGCSDPYTASRNSGPGLGPKSEVNAFTGQFPYPFNLNSSGNAQISGRLQVRSDDINPALNAGALYWVEGQYTTQDDAAAGNADNNASHRPVSFNASFNMSFLAGTIQQLPAIRQWKLADPGVVETDIRVPNEGLMILAARVTDNGNGTWHYEYALFNQNSDRSARSFSVPVGGATITNIGFHDVDYHSGEPFALTDWTPSIAGGMLTWINAQSFGQNPFANALRWGTLYNFRFDANVEPDGALGNINIGLFKPGSPSSISAPTVIPKPAPLFLTLAGEAPTDVLATCSPVSFNVNIAPGADTLNPATAQLFYSYDGGQPQSSLLEPLGGTLYRATLPPAPCGATAKFYVSAQGTLGETVYLPDTAPTVGFQPQVGTPVSSTLVDADFEGGLPAGWTASSLWNITGDCALEPAVCNGGQYAYFGQTSTCNYDTGAVGNGNLSFTTTIPAGVYSAELRYCSNFQREQFALSDWPSVKIGAATIDQPAFGGLGSSPWVERVVNLNAYIGQTVTINFNFNTTDAFVNEFRGWQIDNVNVTFVNIRCNKGDLDGNGVADGRDLDEFVAAALAQSSAASDVCHADFNADNVVDVLDIQAMTEWLVDLP